MTEIGAGFKIVWLHAKGHHPDFQMYDFESTERGKLTLREASDLLGLTLSETIDHLAEIGVKGNIKLKDVMESLKAIPR